MATAVPLRATSIYSTTFFNHSSSTATMDTAPTIFLAALLLIPLLSLLIRRCRHRLQLPPGPTGYPILGALPLLGPFPHVSLARLAKRHGPVMYIKMGSQGALVASTPAAARTFLTTLDVQFANRPINIASRKDISYDFNDLAFCCYGPRLKLFRRLLSLHMLGGKALNSWAYARRAETRHLVNTISEYSSRGEPITVPEVVVFATANILGQVMLSRRVFDARSPQLKEFKKLLTEVLTGTGLFNIGDFLPSIAWMDLQGVQAKMKNIHERFDAIMESFILEHQATAAEREGHPDFLDLVFANRTGDDGETLSDVNIKGLISNLFIAGSDTSSIIVEWALAEMLRNPAILKRLQAELDGVIGRERMMEESDMPNLPYLQAVCKEALRLHPSTPLNIPHYSFQPCEVDGYRIPANTRLLVNIWAIGRDPDVWERPLEFDPDRFMSGKGAKMEPNGMDFELIPFGAGRRICAGKNAGMVFVQSFLGTLVHAFDWAAPEGEEIDMAEMAGLALPKAVHLKAFAKPRLAPSAYE